MQPITEENITDLAVARWQTAGDERLAELMTAFVRHLHAFAREVELTEAEWMAAIEWLTAAGQISDAKRQELILASDVVGLSMLVVQMGHRFAGGATPATVLGPFHIPDSPPLPFGADMSDGLPGERLYIHGRVTGLDGSAVSGALLDVWQADAEGIYEAQLGEVDEARLRALFRTRDDGSYCLATVAPLGYSIPMDGPVGDLVGRTEISHFRPAHIHFMVEADGYERLITHLFQDGSDHLDSDVVFGVKRELIVGFERRDPGPTPDGASSDEPFLVAEYDFVLQPRG